MQQGITLITGANGEIGQALLRVLDADRVLALDLNPLDPRLAGYYLEFVQGDILDRKLLEQLGEEFEIARIFHLAAVLSSKVEGDPGLAHRVNVEGTANLLKLALAQGEKHSTSVSFLFPSSFAVYGLVDLEAKQAQGPVGENEKLMPSSVYGAGKLYCERLGEHFAEHSSGLLDFRALRFPGLISAETIPSGGTTDYGPEMLHCAAEGKSYRCFVRPRHRASVPGHAGCNSSIARTCTRPKPARANLQRDGIQPLRRRTAPHCGEILPLSRSELRAGPASPGNG